MSSDLKRDLSGLLRSMRAASGIQAIPLTERQRDMIPGLQGGGRAPEPEPEPEPETYRMPVRRQPPPRVPPVDAGPDPGAGPARVAQLLKRLQPETARRLVRDLHQRDPGLAVRIGLATHPGQNAATGGAGGVTGQARPGRERFAHLACQYGMNADPTGQRLLEMAEPELQRLLRALTHGTLVIFTKTADSALAARILANLSSRKAQWLADDLAAIRNITPVEERAARQEIQVKLQLLRGGRR